MGGPAQVCLLPLQPEHEPVAAPSTRRLTGSATPLWPDLDNGNLLIVGGTAIDGYPNTNGGKWIGTSETYTYAPASGQVTRIGNATPEWYPGLLEDQLGGVYKHGGGTNGVMTDVWEYLPQGKTTWSRVPWVWKTRYYSDIRLIGPNLAAYTGATSTPSLNRQPAVLNLSTGKRVTTPGLRNHMSRKAAASVLLYPAQEKKVLVIGGVGTGSAIRDVDLIDYSVYPQRVPSFVPRAPLPQGMTLVLTTLLPNGQLFATRRPTRPGADPACCGPQSTTRSTTPGSGWPRRVSAATTTRQS